jgi:hypothetical protein
MNYSLKIDIKKLNKAFVKPIQGKSATIDCVCIPVTEFYHGKNGELYCNIEIVERKTVSQYNDTHFAKQQLEKESYQALSEEQRKNIPILGSFQPSKFGNVQTVVAEEVKTTAKQQAAPDDDDVPF